MDRRWPALVKQESPQAIDFYLASWQALPLALKRSSLRRMRLFQHVHPLFFASDQIEKSELGRRAVEHVVRAGLVASGKRVILTLGDEPGFEGGTNTMKIVTTRDPEGDHGQREFESL